MTTSSKLTQDLMTESGVQFGTSGARGLVTAMTDLVCYSYTQAFLQHLEDIGDIASSSNIEVAIAGDLRPSSPRIMAAVAKAVEDKGYRPLICGFIPSPAVVHYGLARKIPSVMVTGSHIPDDRNGIKFHKTTGEILKSDEKGLKAQTVTWDPTFFDKEGLFTQSMSLETYSKTTQAEELYHQRYIQAFGEDFLKGITVGVYQHSAVGRDLLPRICASMGAEVIPLGRAEQFIPVDTEAIRPEDVSLAKQWAEEYDLDVLFSTDGDSDRPLIADEEGTWFRGDVLGVLVSRFLQAQGVSTPVSSNSVLEKTQAFPHIYRTRIGSPYVIEGMMEAEQKGLASVVGYEANGGYLTQTSVQTPNGMLSPLPTRDTMIVLLGLLGEAKKQEYPLSELIDTIPPRYTASGRLQEFPTEKSQRIVQEFVENTSLAETALNPIHNQENVNLSEKNTVDGLRLSFSSEEIIHLRPSGNAPEFRCYVEANSSERAETLLNLCLKVMEGWK
jgi:phosphomannomutase